MTLWLRELAGWLLVAWGALLLYDAALKIDSQQIFEAGPLTVIGIIVFRGGIHLLKVAVAARICMKAPPLTPATDSEVARRGVGQVA